MLQSGAPEGRESSVDGFGPASRGRGGRIDRPWVLGSDGAPGAGTNTGGVGAPPPVPWDVLLGVQPFTGLLNTVTVRHQAASFRQSNDSAKGLWRYLTEKQAPVVGDVKENVTWVARYIKPLVPSWASGYMFLYQIIEGWALVWLTERIHKGIHKQVKRFFESSARSPSLPSQQQGEIPAPPTTLTATVPPSLDWIGYGLVRSVLYLPVAAVAHPFSIIRTVSLVNGKYTGLRGALPTSGGIYARSYWAHFVSGLADFWLSEVVYRFSLSQLQRFAPHTFPPPHPLARLVLVDEMLEGRQARKATKIRRNLALASLRFFSGFVGRTLAFPLSTIRYRLEAQGCNKLCEVQYDGFITCCKSILHEEGWLGLYRGFTAHLASLVAQAGWMVVVFGLSHLSLYLEGDDEDDDDYFYQDQQLRLRQRQR